MQRNKDLQGAWPALGITSHPEMVWSDAQVGYKCNATVQKVSEHCGPRSLPQQTHGLCSDIPQDSGAGSPEAVSKEEEEKGMGESRMTSGRVEGVSRAKV